MPDFAFRFAAAGIAALAFSNRHLGTSAREPHARFWCPSATATHRTAQPAIDAAEHAPRGELRRYPIGHFSLFHEPWFDRVVDDQIAFRRRTLLQPHTDQM